MDSWFVRPFVSIITPTFNRESFLRRCLGYVLSQDYPDFEWLILDDSENAIADSQLFGGNITYIHSDRRLTIGEKRNLLIERSQGEVIIHFDDDDYYHPSYVSTMMAHLHKLDADMINLRGWYLLDLRSHFFGYWDLSRKNGLHYRCADSAVTVEFFDDAMMQVFENNHLGYGFTYVYKKSVWQKNPFEHVNFNEDGAFAINASKCFKVEGVWDGEGVCLHYLHPQSTSICFPQFNLPIAAFPKLFPDVS